MIRRVFVSSLLGLFLTAGVSLSQESFSFQLVVDSSNPAESVTRDEASKLFLKKTTKWSNGRKVLPVDQVAKSSIRQEFSLDIHRKSAQAIKSYWQTQLYAGRATPPPELTSDQEILSYVRSNAGAIGYISKSAPVGEGVKVVKITE